MALTLPRLNSGAAPPAEPGAGETSPVHEPCMGDVTAAPSAWAVASEARRETARDRLAAVTRAEALHAAGTPWAEADRAAGAEADVSAPTVARWRRRVAGRPRGERVAALLDQPGRGRRAMFTTTQEMLEAVEALVLKGGPHCTAAHARRVLLARLGTAPSVRTVRRWVASLRQERGRALSAATRPDAHRSRRMPAFGAGDRDAFAPNALWELDSTPADLMCADPLTGVLRRHAVVGALEVWSRRGMVLIVPVSRGVAITALLRRCLLAWGVPLAVKTDQGRDYVGRHVTRVLADLEIEHDLCRPYRPEEKPHIERFLGTLTRDLFAHLPGFTGHDVAQAKALRENKSFAARRRGEAPTFELHLTADELQRRCDLWLSGVYETRPHRGLDGMTPRLRAASWTGEVRAIADARALDALLAPAAGDGTRVVSKKGLQVGGHLYIAPELGPLVGERVGVREDAADPARLHVFAADGRFICVAEDPARTGLAVGPVAREARALAGEADREARRRARDLQRRHRPERAMDDVLTAAADSNRVAAFPPPATPHATPALDQAGRAARAADEATTKTPRRAVRSARARIAAANRHHMEEE